MDETEGGDAAHRCTATRLINAALSAMAAASEDQGAAKLLRDMSQLQVTGHGGLEDWRVGGLED